MKYFPTLKLVSISLLVCATPFAAAHAFTYATEFRQQCVSLDNLEEHYRQSPYVFAASLYKVTDGAAIFEVAREWKGKINNPRVVFTGLSEITFPLDESQKGRMHIFFAKKQSDQYSRRLPFPTFEKATCRPPMEVSHLKYRAPDPTDVLLKKLDEYR